MKIIVSHDVDHLFLMEHYRDTFLPGLVLRTGRELWKREISWRAARRRFSPSLNNLEKLVDFNSERGIPQAYFFGMARGLNLSYHAEAAQSFISRLIELGADIGVHGIAYEDAYAIKEERERMAALSGRRPLMIRNHYLRLSAQTHSMMAEVGYEVDSSLEALEQPFRVGNLWVIPISVMDATLLREVGPDVESMLELTRKRIRASLEGSLPFFVINFHDVYFSDGYPAIRDWYVKLIDELLSQGFLFCSFQQAVAELREMEIGGVVRA